MNGRKYQRLALSIAIVSLMLSTSLLAQNSTATTAGSLVEKSITLAAGAEGRGFALINDTYTQQATQRVDYDNPVRIYSIDYGQLKTTTHTYSGAGPFFQDPSVDFNPFAYSTSKVAGIGPHVNVPTFLMSRNTTKNAVSPTITLSAIGNIQLKFDETTEFTVDISNFVAVSLRVSSAEQNKLVALTGLITGSVADFYLYYPGSTAYANVTNLGLYSEYFAFPFLTTMVGDYVFSFASDGISHLKVTPELLNVTSLSMGSYDTGEIKMPEEIGPEDELFLDPAPSQIKAVSCSVSALDEYLVSFSMNEHLTGSLAPSLVECWYFSNLKWESGIPLIGLLTDVEQAVPVMAGVSGNVYMVLVADVPSRFTYSMGFAPTVFPTAPLNEKFTVDLPLPAGSHAQWFKFNITEDSMVRFNRTDVSNDDMGAKLSRFTPDGTVYVSTLNDITTSSWIYEGIAENAYNYAIYMPKGIYGLSLDTTGSSSVTLRINTYPIEDYTLGDAFDIDVYTTKVLAFDVPTAFEYSAFNVTLLSELNASMNYRMTLYDDYNRYVVTNYTDGNTARRGIGNRQDSGSWKGVDPDDYYVEPSGQKWFDGNQSTQICPFVPTYAGRYYLVVDFRFGYNTTNDGQGSGIDQRWGYYDDLTASLRIDLIGRTLNAIVPGSLYEVTYVSLDSSSGSGSTTVTYTAINTATNRMIGLKLTPKVNTWTRVTVNIINGTSGGTTTGSRSDSSYFYIERIFDKILYLGNNTFDHRNLMPLFPDQQVYYNVTTVGGRYNVTYNFEFGALQGEMMIRFLTRVYANTTSLHTVVEISVSHYDTPAFSGLGVPPTTGGLVVRVVDSSSGDGIADASVVSTSQPTEQTALSGVTNSTGYAVFSDIISGDYILGASKSGYDTNSSVSVTVVVGATTSTQISLHATAAVAPFPIEIVLIVVAIVAVALVIIFVAVKKKSKKA